MKEVLQEALKDLKITSEEQVLIAGIEHDLSLHSARIPKFDKDHPFSKDEVQILLLKQRRILKEIVSNTFKRAEADGTISSDERYIHRVLLHKVDEMTATKIRMFMKIDTLINEPNLLVMHDKIGQQV